MIGFNCFLILGLAAISFKILKIQHCFTDSVKNIFVSSENQFKIGLTH